MTFEEVAEEEMYKLRPELSRLLLLKSMTAPIPWIRDLKSQQEDEEIKDYRDTFGSPDPKEEESEEDEEC